MEALIKNYVSGSEKKVKQCYSQEKDTNELLQNEIDATLKYFAAHNPTKVKVDSAIFFPKTVTILTCTLFTIWYWKMTRSIHA